MAFELGTVEDGFDLADDFSYSTKIMVFGVGGAGGNAVAHMVNAGVDNVEYVIANTDVAALRKKDGSKMKRIQIGRKTTRGQGAGSDPSKGQQSAEENREDLANAIDGVSMLFVAAGMGGGTGTGAAPVVSAIAREKKILTVGVVTKPFDNEGANKMREAVKGISEMRKYVDALIVIPNERVKLLKGNNTTVGNAFEKVDEILCKAVMGIITLLRSDGYINVDFADISATLKDSGIAHMAIGTGKGENKIDEALDEVLNSPLLETSISGAKRGLVNISVHGPDSMALEEYDSLTKVFVTKFSPNARFKCGIDYDETLAEDEISIIAFATDFDDDAGTASAENEKPAENAAGDVPQTADDNTELAPAPKPVINIGSSDPQDIELLLRKFQNKDN